MFTKKRIIQFCLVAVIFIAADIWMYNTLTDSFVSYVEERNYNEVGLFVQTAPENNEDIPNWLQGVSSIIPDAQAMYFDYDPNLFTFVPSTGGSPISEQLWNQYGQTTEFTAAMESAYYLEAIQLTTRYPSIIDNDQTTVRVFVAPIIAENGYEASGAVMILVPTSGASGYARLLGIFSVGAAIAFLAVAFVIMFTRDPVTGFMVLGLFIIVGIFVAFPLFEALRLSFFRNNQFSLDRWKTGLSPSYIVALWGSLRLGVSTATISTILGFMIAFLVERTSFKQKKVISTLATMPVISPPFSLSLSIILLFGNNGLISKQLLNLGNVSIYGLGGLTLVQTISMFPIAFLTISGVLRQIDSTVEDASLDLSATRWQTFKSITFPLTVPGILSAWMLVFTNSLADFANPLLLAGNLRVLSTEAYMMVTGRMNDLGGGAVLSFMLLMPTVTAFMVQRFWVSRKSFVTVTGKPSTTLTELTTAPVRRILTTLTWAVLGFILMLYLTIIAGCFVRNWGIDYTFTLENWKAIPDSWDSLTSTVTLALISAPIAGLIAMAAAMLIVRKKFPGKRLLEVLMMTPYAVPGTLIGIAYVIAFNKQPLLLVGTGAIIVINYVIRELPVGLENGITALHQIDPSIEEAAQDLGADVPTVFRTIVLPLVRPAFISSMSYTFVRSMTAVSAIIFLISAKWYHLTIKILSYSENLRFGLASVLCTVLIIIVLGVFGLLQVLVKDDKLTQKTISTR
ncbi:ABC transporter permease [Pleomorphochaeta sp. DL1XJH-081]|uniref:ABC transporter permease n=1 Tax=Pleomorphochaeta sp. DL1XJH-081 TaxID=3409690 RepID=UPI003BB78AF0